jgi:hypothetical protein
MKKATIPKQPVQPNSIASMFDVCKNSWFTPANQEQICGRHKKTSNSNNSALTAQSKIPH